MSPNAIARIMIALALWPGDGPTATGGPGRSAARSSRTAAVAMVADRRARIRRPSGGWCGRRRRAPRGGRRRGCSRAGSGCGGHRSPHGRSSGTAPMGRASLATSRGAAPALVAPQRPGHAAQGGGRWRFPGPARPHRGRGSLRTPSPFARKTMPESLTSPACRRGSPPRRSARGSRRPRARPRARTRSSPSPASGRPAQRARPWRARAAPAPIRPRQRMGEDGSIGGRCRCKEDRKALDRAVCQPFGFRPGRRTRPRPTARERAGDGPARPRGAATSPSCRCSRRRPRTIPGRGAPGR